MFQIKVPSNILIAGASGSGKTIFTFKLIKHADELFTEKFDRIIYHYGIWQSIFNTVENVEFIEGWPDHTKFTNNKKPILIVIDDLMVESGKSDIDKFFTKYSHHYNL